jgi:hypothetical protein
VTLLGTGLAVTMSSISMTTITSYDLFIFDIHRFLFDGSVDGKAKKIGCNRLY